MNKIYLQFDKQLTALSGNEFGHFTYQKQIKDKIDLNVQNQIIFGNSILIIGISFVKGMFSDLIKDYGIGELKKKISFSCSSKEVEKSIWDSLEF